MFFEYLNRTKVTCGFCQTIKSKERMNCISEWIFWHVETKQLFYWFGNQKRLKIKKRFQSRNSLYPEKVRLSIRNYNRILRVILRPNPNPICLIENDQIFWCYASKTCNIKSDILWWYHLNHPEKITFQKFSIIEPRYPIWRAL